MAVATQSIPHTLEGAKELIKKENQNQTDRSSAQENLARIDGELAQLRKKQNALFHLEKEARAVLNLKIDALQKERNTLAALHTIPYSHVSHEPLTWRRRNGLPVFALFSLTETNFHISAQNNRDSIHSLPEQLKPCYTDVRATLEKKRKLRNTAWWVIPGILSEIIMPVVMYYFPYSFTHEGPFGSCFFGTILAALAMWIIAIRAGEMKDILIIAEYNGVIPDDARAKIHKARNAGQFQDIFILAEIDQWKWNKTVVPYNFDPLVLGYKDGHLYLIADYDTTPIETYVKSEYVV